MKEEARKILKMRDPQRLFAIALLLSPYADREGNLRESPLKLFGKFFYPGQRDARNPIARLVALMREAGYLENKNAGGNRGEWVLHLPAGAQSLAGHEMAVQMRLITDITELVQRWSPEKIPTIISILEAMQHNPK